MTASSDSKFLFVVNAQGNQISQYRISTGGGSLTPNTAPTISTGANPVSIAIRTGTTAITATGGTLDLVFVANRGAATVSSYSFDTTVGLLGVVPPPLLTGGQPSIVIAR